MPRTIRGRAKSCSYGPSQAKLRYFKCGLLEGRTVMSSPTWIILQHPSYNDSGLRPDLICFIHGYGSYVPSSIALN